MIGFLHTILYGMQMVDPRKTRVTRQDWLTEGLLILRDRGEQGLTVEGLCSRMDKTKGSFYHHFAGREDFVSQLLDYWEQAFTGQIIEDLSPLQDPKKRLRALGKRTAEEVDLRLERTIRMWSDREPAAREVVDRVDQSREEYLREQFEEATGDSKTALNAARLHLALLVGTQMLYQDLSQDALRDLNSFIDQISIPAIPEK